MTGHFGQDDRLFLAGFSFPLPRFRVFWAGFPFASVKEWLLKEEICSDVRLAVEAVLYEFVRHLCYYISRMSIGGFVESNYLRSTKCFRFVWLIHNYCLHLRHSHADNSFSGMVGWGCVYIKGVTERFGFDVVRISQVQTVSQKQSNGNAPGVFYMYSP